LSTNIRGTTDLGAALQTSQIIVCAVPTQEIRAVFSSHVDNLNGKILVNTSKGLEIGTHMRVSEIWKQLCPGLPYAMLSGPSFASEVARQLPTAVTLACADKQVATR